MKRCRACGSKLIEEKWVYQTITTDNTNDDYLTTHGGFPYPVDTCMMCGSTEIDYYWQEPYTPYPPLTFEDINGMLGEQDKKIAKRVNRKPCMAKNRR